MDKNKLIYFQATPDSILDVCFNIIHKYGVDKAMSGKEISKYKEVNLYIEDKEEISPHFKDGGKILLSVTEALSMAYIALYYKHRDSNKNLEYSIAIDIEDRYKGSTEREQYLSDGVLAIKNRPEGDSLTPFQQVTAQNIIGKKNEGLDIEQEIITQLNKKIARRNTYHDISGLIISALTNRGSIDLGKIIDSCNLNKYEPTFLILYKDDYKSAQVFYLDNTISSMDDLRGRVSTITPRLAPNT